MFSIITQALRLAAARWPALLAWYLAGWLARYLLIELAATLGANSALLGLMVMPLAALARLGSFLAMFLVLRSAMPSFSHLRDRGQDDVDRTSIGSTLRAGTVSQIFLVSIVPFFAFYAAWKLLAADAAQYTASALSKVNFFDETRSTNSVVDIGLDATSITVVVLAFAGRFALKRFAARLPRWTSIVSVYLEALWVYLTVYLVVIYIDVFWGWVDGRAATHWYNDFWSGLGDVFSPLAAAWSAVMWAVGEVGALALLPLAWLTIAGVIYGRALAKPAIPFRPQGRYYTGFRARAAALPRGIARRLKDVGTDFLSRFAPITNALLLIWRAGVVPMGLFVLAYAILDAASSWLDLAAVRLIGPHDLQSWWMNFDGMLSFVVALIVEPLRLCLIAAAYDFCLRRLEERRAVVDEPAPASASTPPAPERVITG